MYYVYVLARPNGTPFYVGKGKGRRINDHEAEARSGHACYKCRVIRRIWQQGGAVQKYTVLVTASEQEAYDYEKELIARYGRGPGKLTNATDGGEGQAGRVGELSAMAKLTWEQVREIRRRYTTETVAAPVLAREYGVCLGTIEQVVRGALWPDRAYQPQLRDPAIRLQNSPRGEQQATAKLTWEKVREIRRRYPASEIPTPVIARQYGVTPRVIHLVLCNRAWHDPSYDPSTYTPAKPRASGENNHGARLTWEQVREIRARYIPRQITAKMLAAEYGVSSTHIEKILRREMWREPGE